MYDDTTLCPHTEIVRWACGHCRPPADTSWLQGLDRSEPPTPTTSTPSRLPPGSDPRERRTGLRCFQEPPPALTRWRGFSSSFC